MRVSQSQMTWLTGAALVCFVVWDRAIHDVLLVFDTALYNYSLVLPLVYVAVSFVVLVLHHRSSEADARLHARGVSVADASAVGAPANAFRAASFFIVAAPVVACVAGAALLLASGEEAHIALVAVQVACSVALLPALARAVCAQSQRAVGLSAAAALLVAMGVVAACRAMPAVSSWIIVLAPLGVGACLAALHTGCAPLTKQTAASEADAFVPAAGETAPVTGRARSAAAPAAAPASAAAPGTLAPATAPTPAASAPASAPAPAPVTVPFPWPLLGMYALCCLVAQFFLGNVVHPFLMSSDTITLYFTQIGAVFAVALGVQAALGRGENVNALFSVALLLLVAGLVLFATGVLQSLILPIGLVAAAADCLYGLSWVLLAHVARTWRTPPVPLFTVGMMVCEGTVGLFTSAFLKRMVVMNYEALTFTSVACIAAFAVFYLCLSQMHARSMRLVAQEALQNVSRAQQELPHALTAEQAARAMEVYLDQRADNFKLTPREREVLPLVVQGLGNKEIAAQLNMSESTVKYHLRNMYAKCKVRNRSEFADLFRA